MKLGSGHVGFLRYIESMASPKCAAIASRRSCPFALIAGVEPAVRARLGCLLRPVPIGGKNVWPPDENLAVVAQLHRDATDRRSDRARLDVSGIVHGANRSRLGEPVALQHWNSEH